MIRYISTLMLLLVFGCINTEKANIEGGTIEKMEEEEDSFLIIDEFNCETFLSNVDTNMSHKIFLKLYDSIGDINWGCSQKLLVRFHDKFSRKELNIEQNTPCSALDSINLSEYNKNNIVVLYREMLARSNDDCPLNLLEMLHNGGNKYAALIDTLTYHVDGYVSEYFCDLFPNRCEGILPITK